MVFDGEDFCAGINGESEIMKSVFILIALVLLLIVSWFFYFGASLTGMAIDEGIEDEGGG